MSNMVNRISINNKRDVEKKPNTTLNIYKNSRNKPSSQTNVPHKQESTTNLKRGEQYECLNATLNNSGDSCNQSTVLNSMASGPSCSNEVINLASPGLSSALCLANKIKAAKANIVPHIKLCDFQKEIKHKVVKKTNVPFSEHIFHNLVHLQINDEDIVTGKKTSTKSHGFVQKKDNVFHLEDYYKPYFSLEFCNEVPFRKREIEKVQHYDGFEIYHHIKSLETFNQ